MISLNITNAKGIAEMGLKQCHIHHITGRLQQIEGNM
jgi:hypothetical protein